MPAAGCRLISAAVSLGSNNGDICQIKRTPERQFGGREACGLRNFWSDFGGNTFTGGLMQSVNNEKMTYARDMLRGRKPARDDIPCSTCDIYIARRSHSKFIVDD
jgi:hypothetical protein